MFSCCPSLREGSHLVAKAWVDDRRRGLWTETKLTARQGLVTLSRLRSGLLAATARRIPGKLARNERNPALDAYPYAVAGNRFSVRISSVANRPNLSLTQQGVQAGCRGDPWRIHPTRSWAPGSCRSRGRFLSRRCSPGKLDAWGFAGRARPVGVLDSGNAGICD